MGILSEIWKGLKVTGGTMLKTIGGSGW